MADRGRGERLVKAAENERDRAMILVAYRHGLRVSERVALQWRQLDLDGARVRVERLKGSESAVPPLAGREVRLAVAPSSACSRLADAPRHYWPTDETPPNRRKQG